jgi:hypothetical protein
VKTHQKRLRKAARWWYDTSGWKLPYTHLFVVTIVRLVYGGASALSRSSAVLFDCASLRIHAPRWQSVAS